MSTFIQIKSAASGGGSSTYFLNQTVTQGAYKEFSSVSTVATEQVVPLSLAGGTSAIIAEYLTPTGFPGSTQIIAGLWQFFLHFNAATINQNWIIRPTVYKVDTIGNETLILTLDPVIVTNMSTTTTMYVSDAVIPATTLLTTDRILVKITMENTTGVSQTVNFRTEGSQHYSVASTTLNQVIPSGGGSGVFGIANALGVYTYYTTLTLAMAAAVSGQVIEMFADVIETGAVSVTLKNGVNINGNGHTYTLNTATATNLLIDNGVAVTCSIFGITFKSLNTTGTTYVLYINGASKINGNGSSNFYSDTKYGIGINNSNADVSGMFGFGLRGVELSSGLLSNSSGEALFLGGSMGILVGPGAKAINCIGKSLSGGTAAIYNEGILLDSTAYATSTIAIHGGGIVYNCVAYSTGSIAIVGGTVTNSTGYSSASIAITAGTIISSTGYSTAGAGIQVSSGTIQNSAGYSTSSNGILMQAAGGGAAFCWNSFAFSQGAAAISQTNNNTTYGTSQISNCTIICSWDNVGGHAINASGTTNIANCTMRVLNASAKAIYSASTLTLKYANNTYEGSTAPISTTITQGIVNTHDNQGNILI